MGEEILDLRTLPIRELKQRIRRPTEDSLKQEWLTRHGETHGITSLFAEPAQALFKRQRTGRWTLEHQTRCAASGAEARGRSSGSTTRAQRRATLAR
eukprot:4918250-Pyramimonas_sp.AAC.1